MLYIVTGCFSYCCLYTRVEQFLCSGRFWGIDDEVMLGATLT